MLELADGRIYTGQQALATGLIDRLGNFTDAISLAAELGGLETEDPHLIYPKPARKFSLLHFLTEAAPHSFLRVERRAVVFWLPLPALFSFTPALPAINPFNFFYRGTPC